MSSPAVTVVITAYQRVHYLRKALESVLAQTYGDFEAIICDDSNSPEIAALVTSFKDTRLRYRGNLRALGIAMNHRAGYEEARGRYIANLDDDDMWEPEFLSTLIAPLEADPSIIIAFCDPQVMDGEGRVIPERTEALSLSFHRTDLTPGRHADFLEMAVVEQTIPFAMGAMFRRSLVAEAFPSRIGGSYDYWLTYVAAKSGQAAYYVPQRLTRYRIHSGSGTATRGAANLRNIIYVQQHFLADPQLAIHRPFLQNNLGIFYGKLALLYIRKGTYHRAWVLLRHAFTLLRRPKNIVGLLKNCLARWVTSRAT